MAAKQHRVHLGRLRRLRDESLRLRSFAVVAGLVDGLDYSPTASAFFLAALGRTLRPHAGIVEALAGRECLIELDKCALVSAPPPLATPTPAPTPSSPSCPRPPPAQARPRAAPARACVRIAPERPPSAGPHRIEPALGAARALHGPAGPPGRPWLRAEPGRPAQPLGTGLPESGRRWASAAEWRRARASRAAVRPVPAAASKPPARERTMPPDGSRTAGSARRSPQGPQPTSPPGRSSRRCSRPPGRARAPRRGCGGCCCSRRAPARSGRRWWTPRSSSRCSPRSTSTPRASFPAPPPPPPSPTASSSPLQGPRSTPPRRRPPLPTHPTTAPPAPTPRHTPPCLRGRRPRGLRRRLAVGGTGRTEPVCRACNVR